MTLLARTTRREQRRRQQRAELRMDEIVSVAGIGDNYDRTDRIHDLEIHRAFRTVYEAVDSAAEKEAVASCYATWRVNDNRKDLSVRTNVGDSVELLKTNNDFWLADGCGPDGQAA